MLEEVVGSFVEVREVQRSSGMFEEVSGRFKEVSPSFEGVRGGSGAVCGDSRGSKMFEDARGGFGKLR